MQMTRRTALMATGALLATGRTFSAYAADYPDHSVKIIVPFGAGGPADIFSRQLAQYLSDTMKQSFVIDNRPGAGSAAVAGRGAGLSLPPGPCDCAVWRGRPG